ncbi:MAG: hypothetical protein M0C28_39240 [Candidatus Moduliflexus flocculans]|nr:hypothetical protein [Candidatus Moduliflexus flocculans]
MFVRKAIPAVLAVAAVLVCAGGAEPRTVRARRSRRPRLDLRFGSLHRHHGRARTPRPTARS